jgi:hypothetical protein
MLSEEIKKKSPFATMLSSKGPSASEDHVDKMADLSLYPGKNRTPTRPPILIKSLSKPGTSLPGASGFLSHSMPVRPVIGSLPGPAMAMEMPALNLPPTQTTNSPLDTPALPPGSIHKDEQGELVNRSLIKHHDEFHIPLKKSYKYAASCPSTLANFPVDIIEKMSVADGLDEDEPMLGTSVTAFSLLESRNLGKSPPDDSDFLTRMRASSVGSRPSFDGGRVGETGSNNTFDEEMTFDFDDS